MNIRNLFNLCSIHSHDKIKSSDLCIMNPLAEIGGNLTPYISKISAKYVNTFDLEEESWRSERRGEDSFHAEEHSLSFILPDQNSQRFTHCAAPAYIGFQCDHHSQANRAVYMYHLRTSLRIQ